MRFSSSICVVVALLLTGCANEGVIVQKDSVPLPFYESLGVVGSYKLALRDRSGAVHSQLATPEVFEGYAQGEYFNDLQPGPAQSGQPAADEESGPYMPVRVAAQTRGMGGSQTGRGHRVASNVTGSGHRPAVAKASKSSAKPFVASAPAPVVPKEQSPIVSGQFALAVQEPASARPLTSVEKYSSHPTLAAKLPTAPSARSVESTPRVSTQAVARTDTTTSPSRTMAFTTPAKRSTQASSKRQDLAGKKSAKPAAVKSAKKKTATSSQPVRTGTSADSNR